MSMMGGGANLGTATFYITGNAQGASNAAAQANNALAQLSNTVATNWWGIQNLGLAFAALPGAVMAGTGAAINAAVEWQDALFTLQRSTGGTAEEAAALGDEILDVARKVPLATAQLADLAATAATLGIEDVAKFAEVFGTLISATNLTEANVGDFARVINVMQVPESQFERFANTLLEVGRNTAATETEILNITRRMSGAAATAGFTSDQLLGLGAAVISLGPRAEAGATALNKTINDITRSIGTNNETIQTWAAVSGQSVEEFSALFREDAAAAVAAFVSGLARLQGGGEDQIAVLDDLGITEARQVSALQQLARGTLDVGNEQRDLNAILGFSEERWQNSNATQDIAALKAKTLSGQLQLLRNALFEFGTVIGGFFIGPLGFFVQRLLDFLAGVQALPAPLKILMGALFLLLTALSAVAAAVFLIGPRILIAYDAFTRLRGGTTQLTPQIQALGASMLNTARSAGIMSTAVQNASRQAIIAANNTRLAATAASSGYQTMQNNLANLAGVLAVGSASASASMSRMAVWGTRLAKVSGWVTAALTVLSIATTFLGNRQREQAEAAERALAANADLVSIIRQQGAQVGPASTAWLQQTEAYQRVSVAARQLGFDLEVLNRIITGQGTPGDMDALTTAIRNGDADVRAMAQDVLNLTTIYRNSADASGVAAEGVSDLGSAQAEAAEQTRENTEALQEQARLLEGIAQAHIDLADAVDSQLSAQLDLADAQEEYARAMADAKDPTLAIARAELELAQARFDSADAQRDLRQNELALAEARAKGLRRARDAEMDLADAQDRYRDSLETIKDLEERVAELRLGPSADALRDATNDLRNAELRLARAHQGVADAEWYLQHLREEGASQRDIEDAEMALAEARQETADAEDEVIDKTKDLNDLRDGTKQAEALADAEQELQRAMRDSVRALEEVSDRQDQLADARERVANDTDYLDAQSDIVDSQLAVQDALQKVQQAELDLEAIRAGRAERDALRAALDLENAIMDMAQANVEVRRQQALANGQTWDAGDAAHALADELQNLMGLAPDAASAQRLQNYIDTLRSAPNVPDVIDSGGGADVAFDPTEFGMPALSDVSNYLDELRDLINGDEGPKSIWSQLWDSIGGGSGVGGIIGGGIGLAVGGPAGAIVGGLIGSIIGGLVEKFWPQISNFFRSVGSTLARNIPNWFGNVVQWFKDLPGNLVSFFDTAWDSFFQTGRDMLNGLWEGIKEVGSNIIHGIGNWLYSTFVAPFKAIFGIHSPSTVFAEIGRDLMRGLWNGIVGAATAVWNFFTGIGRGILNILSGAGNWLLSTGSNIIHGLWSGLTDAVSHVWEFFTSIPETIFRFFGNAGDWLFNFGKNILTGLWNGIVDIWNNTVVPGWNTLIGWIPGSFADGLQIGSPSRVFEGFGQNVIQGLVIGLESEHDILRRTLADTAEILSESMNNVDPFAGIMAGLSDVGIQASYIDGLLSDMNGARVDFATSVPGIGAATGNVTYVNETLNLEAITTADPEEIVNEYVWAKRVRMRGA